MFSFLARFFTPRGSSNILQNQSLCLEDMIVPTNSSADDYISLAIKVRQKVENVHEYLNLLVATIQQVSIFSKFSIINPSRRICYGGGIEKDLVADILDCYSAETYKYCLGYLSYPFNDIAKSRLASRHRLKFLFSKEVYFANEFYLLCYVASSESQITEIGSMAYSLKIALETIEKIDFDQSANLLQDIPHLAHDLRSPLANVKALFYLLQRESITDQASKYVKLGVINCNSAKLLIDDLIDISRVSGEVATNKSTFDILELFEELYLENLASAEIKGLSLEITRESLQVHADSRQIYRVLSNLLSNAIKYSNVGKVRLQAKAEGGCILVSVVDTGIGFMRSPREFSKIDSMSIGLLAVRKLLENHNSKLEITSNSGCGSCVSFRLNKPTN